MPRGEGDGEGCAIDAHYKNGIGSAPPPRIMPLAQLSFKVLHTKIYNRPQGPGTAWLSYICGFIKTIGGCNAKLRTAVKQIKLAGPARSAGSR